MFQITNVQTFAQLGIQLEWRGEAENEIGTVKSINKDFPLFLLLWESEFNGNV